MHLTREWASFPFSVIDQEEGGWTVVRGKEEITQMWSDLEHFSSSLQFTDFNDFILRFFFFFLSYPPFFPCLSIIFFKWIKLFVIKSYQKITHVPSGSAEKCNGWISFSFFFRSPPCFSQEVKTSLYVEWFYSQDISLSRFLLSFHVYSQWKKAHQFLNSTAVKHLPGPWGWGFDVSIHHLITVASMSS